jgi:hypothetical protein
MLGYEVMKLLTGSQEPVLFNGLLGLAFLGGL